MKIYYNKIMNNKQIYKNKTMKISYNKRMINIRYNLNSKNMITIINYYIIKIN